MSPRTLFAFRSARHVVALACFGLSGCGSTPGGPEYTELGINAEDVAGRLLGDECTPLPVLPGGTVVRDFALAPGLSAHVFAVSDSVAVTLGGIDDLHAGRREFSQQTLYDGALHGGYLEALSVTTLAGDAYLVFFGSPCTQADSTPPGL
jgi:hypothetical protein